MSPGTVVRAFTCALLFLPFGFLALSAHGESVTEPTVSAPGALDHHQLGDPVVFQGTLSSDSNDVRVVSVDFPDVGCTDTTDPGPGLEWACQIMLDSTHFESGRRYTFNVMQETPVSSAAVSPAVPVTIRVFPGEAFYYESLEPFLAVTTTNSPLATDEGFILSGTNEPDLEVMPELVAPDGGSVPWENECNHPTSTTWACSYDPPGDLVDGDYRVTINEFWQETSTSELRIDSVSSTMTVVGPTPPTPPSATPPASTPPGSTPVDPGPGQAPDSVPAPGVSNTIATAPPVVTPPGSPVEPSVDDPTEVADDSVEDLAAQPAAEIADSADDPGLSKDDALQILGLGVAAMTILATIGPLGLARASDSSIHRGGGTDPLEPVQAAETLAASGVLAGAGVALADKSMGSGDRKEAPAKSGKFRRDGIAWGDRSATWRFPGWRQVDVLSLGFPPWLSRRSPLTARVLADGAYIRAMFGSLWGLLPLLGIGVGLAAAADTEGLPLPPALGLVVTILVIAMLDSTAGAVGFVAFSVSALLSGGFSGGDKLSTPEALRGILGLGALWFAIPLIAAAARPFRRMAVPGTSYGWDRLADTVIAALIAGWAAEKIVDGLPGLVGMDLPLADYSGRLALLIMALIAGRFILEETAAKLYPRRLAAVQKPHSLPAPGIGQQHLAVAIRTVIFGSLAHAVIGNCWQLWAGLGLFAVPQVLAIWNAKFPNIARLHRSMPRGIVKILVMLVVGTLFARFVFSVLDDPDRMLRDGFLLLTVPGLVLDLLGLFGRKSPALPWTWPKQLAGAAIVAITVVLVLTSW